MIGRNLENYWNFQFLKYLIKGAHSKNSKIGKTRKYLIFIYFYK